MGCRVPCLRFVCHRFVCVYRRQHNNTSSKSYSLFFSVRTFSAWLFIKRISFIHVLVTNTKTKKIATLHNEERYMRTSSMSLWRSFSRPLVFVLVRVSWIYACLGWAEQRICDCYYCECKWQRISFSVLQYFRSQCFLNSWVGKMRLEHKNRWNLKKGVQNQKRGECFKKGRVETPSSNCDFSSYI